MPLTKHTPNFGRARTLEQTGQAMYVLGLAVRPLTARQVYGIEQRALRKLREAMLSNNSGQEAMLCQQ